VNAGTWVTTVCGLTRELISAACFTLIRSGYRFRAVGADPVSVGCMTTDFPAAVRALLEGDLDVKSYLRSLRDYKVEAVFSREDLLPGLAEIFLVPYIAVKRFLNLL
jgi:hypothetical protein